jgi:hypothetical protein
VRFCQSCGRPTAPAPIPTSFTNAGAATPALSSSPKPRTASYQQLVEHYRENGDKEILRLLSSVEDLTGDAKNDSVNFAPWSSLCQSLGSQADFRGGGCSFSEAVALAFPQVFSKENTV